MYKLLKNWKVVILSIGGATTFWFFNAFNKDYTARIHYPIEFQFEKDSVVVMEPLPTTVTVDVSSGGWNLLRNTFLFNITPIQIELDNPTEISYYARASLFPLVSEQLGLTINSLVTDTIFIRIEKKKQRWVSLAVDSTNISLKSDFRITSDITIEPDSALLVGPKSFIDTIGNTYVFGLAAKNINDPFSEEVSIGLPDPLLMTITPARTKVAFQVERFVEVEVKVPVELVNFPKDSSILLSQREVLVAFRVQKSKNRDYTPADFAVTADLSMRNREDSTVMAMLIFYPEELTDIQLVPEYIPLRYE